MPYRLHLLRLPQLLLETRALGLGSLAFGDVPRDGDRVGGAAIAHGNCPYLDEETRAVLADRRRLDLTRLACKSPAYERVECVHMVKRKTRRKRLSDYLVAQITVHLEVSGIRIDHATIGVPKIDGVH